MILVWIFLYFVIGILLTRFLFIPWCPLLRNHLGGLTAFLVTLTWPTQLIFSYAVFKFAEWIVNSKLVSQLLNLLYGEPK